MPQRKNKKSPKRVKRTSPKRVKRTSPKRVKRTSPKRVKRTSPKRVKRTSPKRKVRSKRLNPGFMRRLFGRQARQIPGGDDQTGLLPVRDYSAANNFYLEDIRNDLGNAQDRARAALAEQNRRRRIVLRSTQMTRLQLEYKRIVRDKLLDVSGRRLTDRLTLEPMDRRKQLIDRYINYLNHLLKRQDNLIRRQLTANNLVTIGDIHAIITRVTEDEKSKLYSLYIS